MTQPLRADELFDRDAPPDEGDLAAALATARFIERVSNADGVRPSPDFGSRVMAAVARQPAPRRRTVGLLGLLWSTWGTARNPSQPPPARARAFLVVLMALVILGSLGGAVTLAAAGALNLFAPPPAATALPSLGPDRHPSPRPSVRPEPGKSPEATERVEPSETPEPNETPEPGASNDDGSEDDGGHFGSPPPTQRPGPGGSPRSAGSPEPSDD